MSPNYICENYTIILTNYVGLRPKLDSLTNDVMTSIYLQAGR